MKEDELQSILNYLLTMHEVYKRPLFFPEFKLSYKMFELFSINLRLLLRFPHIFQVKEV